MRISLVVLAAGLSTRYGRLKQLDPVGPSGEALMDYGIFDAVREGVGRVVPVVREEIAGAVEEHVRALVGDAAEVVPAVQALDDVPSRVPVPAEREKPWGTGHAVLAARHVVDGTFLVMNADDFYGREAFRRLVEWARGRAAAAGAPPIPGPAGGRGRSRAAGEDAPASAALVPYRLRESLSAHGGVSRGILDVGREGLLKAIREVFRIRPSPVAGEDRDGGPVDLRGEDRDGRPVELTGEELFSANLWGFGREVLPVLEEGFASFLRERGHDPDAEFLIADGLRPALREGRLDVRVLERGRMWLGVTHSDDRPAVAARLREMVKAGAYPPDLRGGEPRPAEGS